MKNMTSCLTDSNLVELNSVEMSEIVGGYSWAQFKADVKAVVNAVIDAVVDAVVDALTPPENITVQ